MKNFILILVAILCSIVTAAQDINTEIISDGETPFLLGKINKDGLTSENYNDWFSKNYEDYELDQTTIESISTNLKDYQITLFMGTWCGDSKLEVPHFYKVLEACNFPEDQLTVIALNRKPNMYKKSPNHEEAGLNIHRVPTFIFYKDRKEVNRIVEHPVESLEKDILSIITSNTYQSNYQIVTKINTILNEDGLNGLKKQSKRLIKAFDKKVTSMSELNTYGHILYSINRNNEAIAVFKLNNKLFPDNPRTHMSLANILGINGYSNEAVKIMDKAIQQFPKNQDLIENLEALKTR